jgi:DNA-binding HxlR family transcriptional regulator
MAIKTFTGAAAAQCPVRDVLARLSDQWSVLVIVALRDGTRRFTKLKREVSGISPRMLAQTLRRLEQDGLVERTLYPTIPPRVDYALTPLGQSLLDQLGGLVEWSAANHAAISAARARYIPPTAPEAVGA